MCTRGQVARRASFARDFARKSSRGHPEKPLAIVYRDLNLAYLCTKGYLRHLIFAVVNLEGWQRWTWSEVVDEVDLDTGPSLPWETPWSGLNLELDELPTSSEPLDYEILAVKRIQRAEAEWWLTENVQVFRTRKSSKWMQFARSCEQHYSYRWIDFAKNIRINVFFFFSTRSLFILFAILYIAVNR